MNRCELVCGVGLLAETAVRATATRISPANNADESHRGEGLRLADYGPETMLPVKETHVARERYRIINTHTHITFSAKSVSDLALESGRVP